MIEVQDLETRGRAQVPQELLQNIAVKEEDREPMLSRIDRMLNEPGIINLDMADVEPFFARGCEYMALQTDSVNAVEEIGKWLDGQNIGTGDAVLIYMEGDVSMALFTDSVEQVLDRICSKKEDGSRDKMSEQPEVVVGAAYTCENEPENTAVDFGMWVVHSMNGNAVRFLGY